MTEDHNYGRGDDRFQRIESYPKTEKACMALLVMPVALVAAAAIIVIPFFRR